MNIVLISSTGIGAVNAELDTLLLNSFLQSLITHSTPIEAICLYSQGVQLACKHGTTLELLQILEKTNTKLLICKTCLVYFELQHQLLVGTESTMAEIIDYQLNASKIIRM
jgi:hypothetical protein